VQHLVHNEILVSVRGPHGGYGLARECRRISIGDIVRVVLDIKPSKELNKDEGPFVLGDKVVRPLWIEI
jgi:DNA-binding IscR family transcriptional regulator